MKRWFSGDVIAHYRGQSTKGLLPQAEAEHFQLEVYRALVRNVRLLGDTQLEAPSGSEAAPEPTHEPTPSSRPAAASRRGRNGADGSRAAGKHSDAAPPELSLHPPAIGPALCQALIPIAHFVDAQGPGRSVRGSARDVRISEFRLSHPASRGKVSYGRIEGRISGWFQPPDSPEVEDIVPPPAPRPVGWKSENIDTATFGLAPDCSEPKGHDTDDVGVEQPTPQRTAPETTGAQGAAAPNQLEPVAAPQRKAQTERVSAAGRAAKPPSATAARSNALPPSNDPPFFTAGVAVAVALLFLASPAAATIWSAAFLISFGLRQWLLGVVPDVSGVRLLAVVVCGSQLLITALLLATWSSAGCVALSPLPLLFLLGGMFVASLLPRPLASSVAGALFALVLFQAYGFWAAPFCS